MQIKVRKKCKCEKSTITEFPPKSIKVGVIFTGPWPFLNPRIKTLIIISFLHYGVTTHIRSKPNKIK